MNKTLISFPIEQKDGDSLQKELIEEKDKLEQLFIRYKIIFNELPDLINEYKLQKVRVRIKLRKVQTIKKWRLKG